MIGNFVFFAEKVKLDWDQRTFSIDFSLVVVLGCVTLFDGFTNLKVG
jgi:hypothetical protein